VGGGVEVDGDSTTMTKSLRKRTTVAHSETGVKAVACSGAGDEAGHALGPGSRMAGGSSGAAVSTVIAERERACGQEFVKCGERERGPEILVWGHNARCAPTTRISL
jgi:hypothetical protein